MCLTAEFEMGSGSGHTAQATRPAQHKFWGCSGKHGTASGLSRVFDRDVVLFDPDTDHESDQACRAISTGQLNALPRLHSRPIDVVVFHGPQGRPRFEVGFPLRCLQRLSRPYIAMLHCRWRDNSSTRGTFIPVLSY